MGYASCQVLTVEEYFIEEQCPEEFQELIDSFDGNEGNAQFDSVDDFARSIGNGDLDPKDNPEEPELKYEALQKAFKKKTDLEINLFYHDPDDGDRYDDFTGRAWLVDGVLQYTPAGEKYKDKIKKQSFVTFG